MFIARVVKRGATRHCEGKRAMHSVNGSYDAVPIDLLGCVLNGHEISHFSHAAFRQKAGHEDIGIREIQLFTTRSRRLQWLDLEVTTFFSIEQCAKDAGSIEGGDTVPINGTIFPDERNCVEITNDPII